MLDIDLALPRGSVIRGHVVDEFGTPVVGARVTAESVQYAEGRPQLRGAGLGEPTDDLGRFRLFGLPPGEYYVSVEPPTRVIPGSPQAERMLAEERHVRTYYPGSLVATAATPVRVGFDDEAGDLVLPLLSTQVVVVSGSLSGVPAGTAVRVRLRPVADGTGGAGDLAVSDRLLTVHDAAFLTVGNGGRLEVNLELRQ